MNYSKFARFRTVGKKPAVQKFPAQKSKSPVAFSEAIDKSALKHSRDTLGDAPQYLGFSDKSIREMAGESVALRTESKSYFSKLKKGLRRERRYQADQIKFARKVRSTKMMKKQKGIFVIPKQKLQTKESLSFSYKANEKMLKGPRGTNKFNKKVKKGELISRTAFPIKGKNPGAGNIFKAPVKIRKISGYKLNQDFRFSKLNKKVSKQSQDIYSKTLEKFTGKGKGSSFKNNILKKQGLTVEEKVNKNILNKDWGF
jgi:hypothetical protein|tara:strand:+ start:2694 stop:3464 length:771 start_codon:yes stop_codon:yes gene_type:complete